jgi:hypothetical protein
MIILGSRVFCQPNRDQGSSRHIKREEQILVAERGYELAEQRRCV